jgi:hypothetical protein
MGLVEWEWLETLSTIDPEAVTYKDYVDVGTELAKMLREEQVRLHVISYSIVDTQGKITLYFCI